MSRRNFRVKFFFDFFFAKDGDSREKFGLLANNIGKFVKTLTVLPEELFTQKKVF